VTQPSGIDDPGAIDDVRVPRRGAIELVVHHDGRWDGADQRQVLLQEKVNRYLEYVVDGDLVADNPAARGRRWVVVVETAAEPDARTQAYLRAADRELRRAGGGVRWSVTQPPPE
jgi:hypothetical protein